MTETTPSDNSRRRFLNWFLGTAAGALTVAVLYPVLRFVSPPEVPEASTNQVEAGPTNDAELLEKGFKIVRFGADPVILVRLSETEYRAFAGTCTHLDCIVEFQKDKQRIWCNCHNGEYNLHGQVVAGPPPKPLEPFKVDLVFKGSGQPQTIVVSRA
ncbi:MAG: ubiquinol-cytochrome c reductase iron-sulfur subunit [Thermoanaerobaculia bacterium]|jgi:Rieske Fe-S protein